MLDAEFWAQQAERLRGILFPIVLDIAQSGVRRAALRIGVNTNLANAAAKSWAEKYTDALLEQLHTTNKDGIGKAVADWTAKPGATIAELKAEIEKVVSPQRAELIAVTETTRAYSEGNRISYQAAQVRHWRWLTNNDDLVCPVCGPLNRRVVEIGEPFAVYKGERIIQPPAHPGCRCSVAPVVEL